jgi:hypothetical protein
MCSSAPLTPGAVSPRAPFVGLAPYRNRPEGQWRSLAAVLEVTDGQLHHRIAAVIGIQLDGGSFSVGDQGVVAPVWPQGGLGADQAGASHHQPVAAKGGLGELGDAAVGILDPGPGGLGDRGDRLLDLGGLADGDRVADVVAAQPPGQLLHEAFGAVGGVGPPGAHAGVQHLTGVGSGGQQGVVAEDPGVAGDGGGLRARPR